MKTFQIEKRQEDQINLLRKLWEKPVIEYKSAWHTIERAGLNPLPEKEIPIWLGGFKEIALSAQQQLEMVLSLAVDKKKTLRAGIPLKSI